MNVGLIGYGKADAQVLGRAIWKTGTTAGDTPVAKSICPTIKKGCHSIVLKGRKL